MELHANAALSWSGRRLLARRVVEEGWSLTAAAMAAGVSVRCARKWVGRYRREGERGLFDRSSAPRRVANRTPADRVAAILALRQVRMTGAEIAEALSMPPSTVAAVLRRAGMGRLGRIGLEQPVRYERSRPGELVHIDVKKLGRIAGAGHRVTGDRASQYDRRGRRARGELGWEFVHIAVDDHSRLAYAELHSDERAATVTAFVERALAFFAQHGVVCKRLMTDNGFSYVKNRSLAELLNRHAIRHLTTEPYRPRTNGKVERFHQTMAREWAYGLAYRSHRHRAAALPHWLRHYNRTRPHSSIGDRPPISRVHNVRG